jgi:N-acetylglucosaminyl-diphospho-decaprenol L-rhamnosyltransferase
MKHVGVVVVTHNSEQEIGGCLEAALGFGGSVTVVDNASTDGTCEAVRRYPEVRLLECDRNLGFAGAVNRGCEAQRQPYVLLLNPDAILLDPLDDLVAAMADTQVAVAAGQLVGEDGKAQRGFNLRRFPTPGALALEVLGVNRLWPSNPVNRRYRCLDLDPERPADVEQPAGAFLLLRHEAWRALGGFDESFFPVWFEEVDFLSRAHAAGWRIRYVPSVRARHLGGASVAKLSRARRQVYWYSNLLGYSSRHFGAWGFRAVCGALLPGAFLRMVAEILESRTLDPVRCYGRVIRLAGLGLFRGKHRGYGLSPGPGMIYEPR